MWAERGEEKDGRKGKRNLSKLRVVELVVVWDVFVEERFVKGRRRGKGGTIRKLGIVKVRRGRDFDVVE